MSIVWNRPTKNNPTKAFLPFWATQKDRQVLGLRSFCSSHARIVLGAASIAAVPTKAQRQNTKKIIINVVCQDRKHSSFAFCCVSVLIPFLILCPHINTMSKMAILQIQSFVAVVLKYPGVLVVIILLFFSLMETITSAQTEPSAGPLLLILISCLYGGSM